MYIVTTVIQLDCVARISFTVAIAINSNVLREIVNKNCNEFLYSSTSLSHFLCTVGICVLVIIACV